MKSRIKVKSAFTLIELSLTLGFISVLLITVALITLNVTSTYQKGLTIKALNTAGEDIVDDISHAISSSPSKNTKTKCGGNSACETDGALKFVHVQYNDSYALHTFGSDTTQNKSVPMHGAVCTGRYSYVYTTGYGLNRHASDDTFNVTFKYTNRTGAVQEIKNPRLLKFVDQNRKICSDRVKISSTDYEYKSATEYSNDTGGLALTTYDMTGGEKLTPLDLLDSSDYDLAIYDLSMFSPVLHAVTQQSFYSGTFILATVRGEVNILGTGDYCTEPPDNLATDFNYCAVNKFNFAMRATGELNKEEIHSEQHT